MGDRGRETDVLPVSRAPCPAPPSSGKRLLIIGPSNIGDTILAARAIDAVRRRWPEAHLTLVLGERAQALYSGDPRIQTLIDADHYKSGVARLRLAWALWRYQPHVVVDLRHTAYPFLLKPLSAWRYFRQPPRRVVHARDRHLWKLRAQAPQAGGAAATPAGALWRPPKDVTHVEQLCKRWQLDAAAPLVIICPGARSPIKRWTTAGFAAVADRLIEERSATVVFSGEPKEELVIREVEQLMRRRAHNAVGLVTIRQLGLLMERAALVITNDSASLHLASLADAPTVAIFGPTREDRYGPTASASRTIHRQLFCTPCEQPRCAFNHECMRFVSPEEVLKAALELLGQGARGKGRGKSDA